MERFAKPWTALFVARLDGVEQRMVTDVRPNLVPPERTPEGALRWSEYAWNRSDFIDPDAGCIGLAPRSGKPNPYADDWYRHGAVVTVGVEEAPPGSEPGKSRDGKRLRLADAGKSAASFSVDARAVRHPLASADASTEPVAAAFYLNGAEIAREAISEGDWKRVRIELPAGALVVSSKAGNENLFAVSNLTVSATAELPVSWLVLRRPELEIISPPVAAELTK